MSLLALVVAASVATDVARLTTVTEDERADVICLAAAMKLSLPKYSASAVRAAEDMSLFYVGRLSGRDANPNWYRIAGLYAGTIALSYDWMDDGKRCEGRMASILHADEAPKSD